MNRLNKEYIELLSEDANPSDKFWRLEKRIKEDKKKTGVRAEMSRSNLIYNIISLINEGAISYEDLEEFSDEIWEGLKAGRVYGVSRTRMDVDFTVDGNPMGSVIPAGEHTLKFSVKAADAIDRVEILKDNILDEMAVHSGTWERIGFGDDEIIRVKYAAEFGWGPNPRFYKNILA